jgi:hypothetical protein
MQTFTSINKDVSEEEIYSALSKIGITFPDVHVQTLTIDEYMIAVLERNKEQFNISEELILSNLYHFVHCWHDCLSPYKSLVFFELN